MKQDYNRRSFLEFLGKVILVSQPMINTACSAITKKEINDRKNIFGLTPLKPQLNDELLFSPEISYYSLIQRKTALGNNIFFGDNNDYLAFFPQGNGQEALIWANHEYPEMSLLLEEFRSTTITKEIVEISKKRVGGSFFKVTRSTNGELKLLANDPMNRRFDANTAIPIIADRPIQGKNFAKGTLANCAGGVTPWKTLLTCEENYDGFVGEVHFTREGERRYTRESKYDWTKYETFIPEHYGWVVEINPQNGKAKKLTALGRFSHEGALCITAKDGRTVVYMGDDRENEFIYKFIAKEKNSLEQGELFVADTLKGRWLSLSFEKSIILQNNFKDQTDVLIQTRKAAKLLGATPQDRPEGIAVHPLTGDIFIACTNNEPERPFGKILKISEHANDYLSLTFNVSDFIVGGKEFNFASPDNLIFDHLGNLWCTTDTSGKNLDQGPYAGLGGNALYVIPTVGHQAGKPIRLGSAPKGGEFTGPTFIDKKTMMISLQHPGEHMKEKSQWQSQILILNLSNISFR